MGRVAAISAGPRSASPRGRRAFNFCGFLGFSAMGGVGISACATRQPCLLLPLPLLRGRVGGGATRARCLWLSPSPTLSPQERGEGAGQSATQSLRRSRLALGLHFGGVILH